MAKKAETTEQTSEHQYTFEGEINGTAFKQILRVPHHHDTGGGVGPQDGATKGTVIVFGPVIFVPALRPQLSGKKAKRR